MKSLVLGDLRVLRQVQIQCRIARRCADVSSGIPQRAEWLKFEAVRIVPMNPGLVRLDVASGHTIWARCGEVVREQRRVESRGDRKGHTCTECLNAAQLPTFDQPMTLEWHPVHETERQVLTNVETAIAFIGRAVVWVIPIRSAVVAAQSAIRIRKVNAMRKSVGKLSL